jgi:hypothetical protein
LNYLTPETLNWWSLIYHEEIVNGWRYQFTKILCFPCPLLITQSFEQIWVIRSTTVCKIESYFDSDIDDFSHWNPASLKRFKSIHFATNRKDFQDRMKKVIKRLKFSSFSANWDELSIIPLIVNESSVFDRLNDFINLVNILELFLLW